MNEILKELKQKYLTFDKSKSNKNFILNQNPLNFDNINNTNSILDNNKNFKTIDSNNFLLNKNINENRLTDRYSSSNKFSYFNKSITNLKFTEMYNNSMKKIFKKRIKKKLPDLKNITNSTNLIIQKIRRHALFTNNDYPYSLNDNEYGYKTLRAKEKKDILKENKNKCILEQIDNEEYMSKFKTYFNEELINKESISFKEKDKYNNLINLLIKKINNFKFEHNSCLTKEFFVKRDYKIYLAGKLSINSILIKITNVENNEEKNIFLPFIIIPFYLSIERNIFYFFISKILSINYKEGNINLHKIFVDERKIENYLKIISLNYQSFNNNSILFDEKKLEEKTFYFFMDNNTYIISIIPPYIELSKNEEKIKIKKIVSRGLWLNLYQNNFKNWDLMSLIYLYSFHAFRQIQYSTIKFYSKQIIHLNIDNNKQNNNFPRIKDIDKKISFYIYNNNNEIIKDENLFLFMTLYFYSLDQIYDKNQKYKLYLNLEQTKLLLNIHKEDNNLLTILYKCSLENEEHKGINFNFPLIKAIHKGKMNNYFSRNIKNNNNNKKYSKSSNYKYKKGLIIKLNVPIIEINEINKLKINKKYFEIKEKILNKNIEINIVEMLKDIGNFVINNYNIDIISNNIEKKKIILRTLTQKNIKIENGINNKNSYNPKNNTKDKKERINLRTKLFNKNFELKLNINK